MAYYQDFREYLAALESSGKLRRIKSTVNKDTELMPLVRWQLRGLPEEQRTAFLFEKVTSGNGREFEIPVVVGAYGASRDVYALGMMCQYEEINTRWETALQKPISPVLVSGGPAQEEVHLASEFEREGTGLGKFPVPISTPGFDRAPFITAASWITKDPETGSRNVGNYRAQIKGKAKTGLRIQSPTQHIGIHWQKCRDRGIPLEAALVVGFLPSIAFASIAKVPYGVDELAVAGAIGGQPVELVKCKTVDLEVPAIAEIVLEGHVSTQYLESEGVFGESGGFIAEKRLAPVFEISCITHRKEPIFCAFISQLPPNEGSTIAHLARESLLSRFLKRDCGLESVLEVTCTEELGGRYCVLRMQRAPQTEVWRALHAAISLESVWPKIVIAVDEDIDPGDPDSVLSAVVYRMQPHRDMRTVQGRVPAGDHSFAPPQMPVPPWDSASALLINATRKWDYPPVSLPRREYMERARKIWEKEGLPPLQPRTPWYGYSLGDWPKEHEEEARLAVEGRSDETAEKDSREAVKL